jgi:hypothetical protein
VWIGEAASKGSWQDSPSASVATSSTRTVAPSKGVPVQPNMLQERPYSLPTQM